MLAGRVRYGPGDFPSDKIRRSPLNVLPSHAGTTVYRTPHNVVMDAEPGAAWKWPGPVKFLPDGRIVPAGALGAPPPPEVARYTLLSTLLLSFSSGAFIGALAAPGDRAVSALKAGLGFAAFFGTTTALALARGPR